MGVDIYLESIHLPHLERLENIPLNERMTPLAYAAQTAEEEAHERANALFDGMRSSGFRNGYNNGDVMWVMGKSWPDTVGPMRDADGYLPIERAKELISMIEAQPFTAEYLRDFWFRNIRNRPPQHLSGQIMAMVYKAAGQSEIVPEQPGDLAEWTDFVRERREQLLTILRKSVEMNELLRCSL
jgi:hypothetical protein